MLNDPNAVRWDALRARRLQWLVEDGFGYFPVVDQPYDAAYWQRYRELDESPSGGGLTRVRCELVGKWMPKAATVVDVGIGGGRFVAERPNTLGFDVNPAAIAWLKLRGAWCDPYFERVEAACFWDSLEHIHDPGPLLANVSRFVFVSCPVFRSPEHVLSSKHFKRSEHCWYFTSDGLETFMAGFGFKLLDTDRLEEKCGREDILSAVFKRIAA